MTRVKIIDIETTGLDPKSDLILEIGIIELNLKTGEGKEIFNSLIKEPGFKEKFSNSWMEKKGFLKVEEFENAKPLNIVFDELQEIFKECPVTAFNKNFDLKFLKEKGFSIPQQFPCIMIVSGRHLKIHSPKYEYKWPTLQEAYNKLFPEKPYNETHRAIDDASYASEILYELYRKGEFVELEFSVELAEVYKKFTKQPYDKNNVKTNFEHGARNKDEAIYYLITKFPLHYPKSRKVLKEAGFFPRGCGDINIIDIGCGPFTFSISLIEELIDNSKNFAGGAYKIKILGIDKSEYSLTIGYKLIEEYIRKIEDHGHSISVRPKYDDGDFDDISKYIEDWLSDDPGNYIFLAYNASMSSGIRNLQDILKKLQKYIRNSTFNAFVIEPNKYSSGLDLDNLIKEFPYYSILNNRFDTSCKKPDGMTSDYVSVYSNFEVITIQNFNKYLKNLVNKSGFKDSDEKRILIFNKFKRWVLFEKLFDFIGIKIIEYDFKYACSVLNGCLSNLNKTKFLTYKIQKGLSPYKYRDITLVNFPYILLSILFLKEIGKVLDSFLNEIVYCSRICEVERLDRFYKFFTIGYSKFNNFELKGKFKKKLLCKADIENYFDSINKSLLSAKLEVLFYKKKIDLNLMTPLLECFGEQEGIPIGSPLSSLIANLFLVDLDEKIMYHESVLDYARYMDDIKVILNIDNSIPSKNKFRDFLTKSLKSIHLKLKEEKFEITPIDKTALVYKYNRVFPRLTNKYFKILNPIKYGVGLLLFNLKERGFDLEKNYEKISESISNLLISIGIEFGYDALYRYLILVNHKLEESVFRKEIEDISKSKYFQFKIEEKFLDSDENKLKYDFLNQNRMWLVKYMFFTKKMYNLLYEEMIKWEDIIIELNELNQVNSEIEKNLILERKFKIIESQDFLYSIRMIKYLGYRLTKFKYYKLFQKSNKIISLLSEFIQLYLPIKIIGLILYKYNHIDILKDLLEKCMVRFEEGEDLATRLIYPNDIAYLIHLLGQYYEKNISDLNKDLEYWLNKFDLILLSRHYEEKLAITEFILRLRLSNKIPLSDWKSWLEQSDNLLVLKNLLLCIAFNDESPVLIPPEFKELIIKFYDYDECLMNLTMRLWHKIKITKTGPQIDLFKKEDMFRRILKFPDFIDLDYELRSIFEWEEGFGGIFYY